MYAHIPHHNHVQFIMKLGKTSISILSTDPVESVKQLHGWLSLVCFSLHNDITQQKFCKLHLCNKRFLKDQSLLKIQLSLNLSLYGQMIADHSP